jgi:hypothetical protein
MRPLVCRSVGVTGPPYLVTAQTLPPRVMLHRFYYTADIVGVLYAFSQMQEYDGLCFCAAS